LFAGLRIGLHLRHPALARREIGVPWLS